MRRLLLLIAGVLCAGPAGAQHLKLKQLESVGTRTVAFSARSRTGVCGDGVSSFNDGLSGPLTRFYEDYESYSVNGVSLLTREPWDTRIPPCEPGPVRITVRMVQNAPSWIRVAAGPLPLLGDSVMDLGPVSTIDAAEFLAKVARLSDGRASGDALLPLIMIDSTQRWNVLAAAALDTTRLLRYRRRATNLLARAAATTIPLVPGSTDSLRSVRREAVAAFTRQREQKFDVVPDLLRIARENSDRDTRVAALYQLGQMGDIRAIPLFASMLAGH